MTRAFIGILILMFGGFLVIASLTYASENVWESIIILVIGVIIGFIGERISTK